MGEVPREGPRDGPPPDCRWRRWRGWRGWLVWVAPKAPRSLRVHFAPAGRLVEVPDEAAETVVRDELLAVQLEARRGRDVVGLEPLLDGAALVRVAVYLFRICDGEG